MRRIFLVRHGESEGNVDKNVYKTVGDHEVKLTERGHRQAKEAAAFLANTLDYDSTRLWVSPYTRARETASHIMVHASQHLVDDGWKENIRLCEQQFGLLNGIPDGSVEDYYPDVHKEYGRSGKFYARPPGGESRFDVAVRVHSMFGTLHRDCDRHGIEDVVVVCHGTTMRAFVMEWLHLPVEWFLREPNPKNCSIRLIENGKDKEYVFEGGTP